MHDLQNGQIYMLIIELRDPSIHAIEFVLKDGNHDRWFASKFLNKLRFVPIFLGFNFCNVELVQWKLYFLVSRLKLNHSNFRIEIPASDAPGISHSDSRIPKNLIEQKAYSRWEGRPISLPQQQKVFLTYCSEKKFIFLKRLSMRGLFIFLTTTIITRSLFGGTSG